MAATYLDSSAIVKLAVREPQSDALRKYLRHRRALVSSALDWVEVLRALLPGRDSAVATGRRVLASVHLVRINHHVLGLAGTMLPLELRSLDAIHLATAERVGADLQDFITYDDRMAAAARQLGHRVSAPA